MATLYKKNAKMKMTGSIIAPAGKKFNKKKKKKITGSPDRLLRPCICVGSKRDGLTIMQYYKWYNVPIQRWINISKYKAIKRIKAAVELDKVSASEYTVSNVIYNS